MQHSTMGGCSILLIEDKAHLSRAAHAALEGAGGHVFQASTAADALRVIDEARLSAAVLDYTRSIKDDHVISRRLTALNIPFVFCKEIGRNEAWPHAPVLSRPVDLNELIETLGRLLGHETKTLHAPSSRPFLRERALPQQGALAVKACAHHRPHRPGYA